MTKHHTSKAAMKHPDKPGAGAAKRKGLGKQAKVATVMSEFKHHTLHSGHSKKPVTNRRQAVAIAMSESGQSKKKKK